MGKNDGHNQMSDKNNNKDNHSNKNTKMTTDRSCHDQAAPTCKPRNVQSSLDDLEQKALSLAKDASRVSHGYYWEHHISAV